jgi:hypothetical protein
LKKGKLSLGKFHHPPLVSIKEGGMTTASINFSILKNSQISSHTLSQIVSTEQYQSVSALLPFWKCRIGENQGEVG